jgi:hypothetical protein
MCCEQGWVLKNSLSENSQKLLRVRKLYKRFFSVAWTLFYHPIFDFLKKTRLFQQPQGLSPPISVCDDCGSRSRDVAQKPSLPKIPIPGPRRIVENSLARKCALDRLKKNCLWAGACWKGETFHNILGRFPDAHRRSKGQSTSVKSSAPTLFR